jgi:hypothetical protein
MRTESEQEVPLKCVISFKTLKNKKKNREYEKKRKE